LRNAAYFQHQLPGVPTNIVFILHYWLESWDLLQVKEKRQKKVVWREGALGSKKLKKLFSRFHGWASL